MCSGSSFAMGFYNEIWVFVVTVGQQSEVTWLISGCIFKVVLSEGDHPPHSLVFPIL